MIGLAVLGSYAAKPPFFERMAFAAIVLAAMSRLSRENRARALARLAAWNKRQVRLLERKAEPGAGRIARSAEGKPGALRAGLRLRRLKPGNWAFGRCAGPGAGTPDLMTAASWTATRKGPGRRGLTCQSRALAG